MRSGTLGLPAPRLTSGCSLPAPRLLPDPRQRLKGAAFICLQRWPLPGRAGGVAGLAQPGSGLGAEQQAGAAAWEKRAAHSSWQVSASGLRFGGGGGGDSGARGPSPAPRIFFTAHHWVPIILGKSGPSGREQPQLTSLSKLRRVPCRKKAAQFEPG